MYLLYPTSRTPPRFKSKMRHVRLSVEPRSLAACTTSCAASCSTPATPRRGSCHMHPAVCSRQWRSKVHWRIGEWEYFSTCSKCPFITSSLAPVQQKHVVFCSAVCQSKCESRSWAEPKRSHTRSTAIWSSSTSHTPSLQRDESVFHWELQETLEAGTRQNDESRPQPCSHWLVPKWYQFKKWTVDWNDMKPMIMIHLNFLPTAYHCFLVSVWGRKLP